jgi:hypothetical protein
MLMILNIPGQVEFKIFPRHKAKLKKLTIALLAQE